MSSSSSRAKIAAGSVAILGAALSAVFLLRQDPPEPAPRKRTAEKSQLAAASPPARPVSPSGPQQKPARALATAATRAAETWAPPPTRALSFDVPDCRELTLVSVSDRSATVQAGDSEPEQVQVGDLLESGEVTFVGKHPESGDPIVLIENEAKLACRTVGQRPLAALARVGPSSARDFAAHTGAPAGDPNRVEKMVLKLPAGTSAARADFGSAAH